MRIADMLATEEQCTQAAQAVLARGYQRVTVTTDGPICTTCNGSGTVDEVDPSTGRVISLPCPAGCNGGRQQ